MRTIVGMLVAIAAAPAMAQTVAPACTTAAPLSADLASFATPMQVALGGTVLVGQAATLGLGPADGMHFPVMPAKAPAADSFGGTVAFDVKTTGTYRVALGAGIWVDMVQGKVALASIAHGHGLACSVVKKTVDFALTPGRYTLELSGAKAPKATVMVAKLP